MQSSNVGLEGEARRIPTPSLRQQWTIVFTAREDTMACPKDGTRIGHWLRLWSTLLLLAAWAAGGCAAPSTRREQSPTRTSRPNIVIFLADDQGWNDIGYHGSEIDTPNLDRLAASGVRLEQFYAYPTCSPTRAALLTGRNPSRYGIGEPIAIRSRQALPKDTPTLASRLRKLGYVTGIIGKWHLGLRPEVGPRQYGFDYSYGYFHGQLDPYTHLYKIGDRTWHRNDEFIDEEGHATDLLTGEAIAFIERHQKRPFFLYVPFSVPHSPLNETDRWTGPYVHRIANESRRKFAAAVTHMDDSIGQIVGALARLGQKENTLIVFFSDNGGPKDWYPTYQYDGRYPAFDRLGDNSPLRGWQCEVYEGGIRVPAFVHWPERLRQRAIMDVTSVMDFLPTLLAVARGQPAEVSTDESLEGMNIWPTLAGREATGPRVLYWKTDTHYALRDGDYKLIQDRKTGKVELFDVANDPYEKREVANEQPERVRQMLNALHQQQARDPDKPSAS